MANSLAVAVIGDVNLDIWCTLFDASFSDIKHNRVVNTPIGLKLGGTGGGFALAAQHSFSSVHLFGCIGRDEVGALLDGKLAAAGIESHLMIDDKAPSRVVMLIRDNPTAAEAGTRLLIATENSANERLTSEYIESMMPLLRRCDLLFISGYSLLKEPSRSACLKAMRACSIAKVAVAVDIVPHDIAKHVSFGELYHLISDANILIVELKTILQLRGLPSERKEYGKEDVIDNIVQLRKDFPGRWLLLRFGVGNIDQSLVVSPDGETRHMYTGYQGLSDVAGFGDRLTAQDLYILLSKGIGGWPGQEITIGNNY